MMQAAGVDSSLWGELRDGLVPGRELAVRLLSVEDDELALPVRRDHFARQVGAIAEAKVGAR